MPLAIGVVTTPCRAPGNGCAGDTATAGPRRAAPPRSRSPPAADEAPDRRPSLRLPRRSFEQPPIALALMRARRNRAQGFGHREGEQEVMSGHWRRLLALQPGLRLALPLATRTVSVAAAAGHQVSLAAPPRSDTAACCRPAAERQRSMAPITFWWLSAAASKPPKPAGLKIARWKRSGPACPAGCSVEEHARQRGEDEKKGAF